MTDVRIGVEVGGTFTDWVASQDGQVVAQGKVPSTPGQAEAGALAAVKASGVSPASLTAFTHGSTVATNTILERKGACTALVVTAGFAGILGIQRQAKQRLFDLEYRHPDPLIQEPFIVEAPGRVDASGAQVEPLDCEAVLSSVKALLAQYPLQSIAVCLLNSYVDPSHERELGRELKAAFPVLRISLSSEVSPQVREYERMSTTVMNAYVQPLIDEYLQRLEAGMAAVGFAADFSVVQSNGGHLPASRARVHAVGMVLSGPAAGVVGAIKAASASGIRNIITLDMGGTSCDASIVRNGEVTTTSEYKLGGLPVQVPMLDIVTVGAGGGSIAAVDKGGLLSVGPESAGSVPGPAAYGTGDDFTVTDANLLLGYIRAACFFSPCGTPNLANANAALERLAARLGETPEVTALGVRRLATSRLAQATRLVSVEKGFDPEDYTLVPYGGGGPLHAVDVATELGIRSILVPPNPGTVSAYGLLVGDQRHDYRLSRIISTAHARDSDAKSAFDELRDRAAAEIGADTLDTAELRFTVEARYSGQAYQLTVDSNEIAQSAGTLADMISAFHNAHKERYGYSDRESDVELVTFGLAVTVIQVEEALPTEASDVSLLPLISTATLRLLTEKEGPGGAVYVSRESLPHGSRVAGPLIIEEPTSTVHVPSGWVVAKSDGNLMIVKE